MKDKITKRQADILAKLATEMLNVDLNNEPFDQNLCSMCVIGHALSNSLLRSCKKNEPEDFLHAVDAMGLSYIHSAYLFGPMYIIEYEARELELPVYSNTPIGAYKRIEALLNKYGWDLV